MCEVTDEPRNIVFVEREWRMEEAGKRSEERVRASEVMVKDKRGRELTTQSEQRIHTTE